MAADMAPVHTSAPGKLFLLGEYAVLEGAPALLTAVNRRAHVHVRPIDAPGWRISAPNLGLDDIALGPGGALPVDANTDLSRHLAVFSAVRDTVAERLATPLPALAIHIDTSAFAADGHKLGLGSSAAVAAALTDALLAVAGITPDPDELTRLAITAHRAAQGGTGSGGDVAVAVAGGMIAYTRDMPLRRLAWPENLYGRAVVTGQGASTPELVARVYAYRDRAPADFQRDIDALATIARAVAEPPIDTAAFLDHARAYFQALITLDAHAEAGIVSARHHELATLAARHDGVFKSSGAGGGDVGLLFSARATPSPELAQAFDEAGAEILDLVFDAPGVERHETPTSLG